MNSFLQQILGQHNFHKCDEHLELWGGDGNEFFLIQEYNREDFKSSSEGGVDFFTCEQTNKLRKMNIILENMSSYIPRKD